MPVEPKLGNPQSAVENVLNLPGANLPEQKDELLVAEAVRGNSPAFEILFERYQQKMFHVALSRLQNAEDAEDAVQQTFQQAFIHLKSFQGQARFSTWLTRIAINAALMKLRRARYTKEVPMEFVDEEGKERPRFQLIDGALNPEDTFVEQERSKLLHEALGGLRPRVRAAIEICQLQECSVRETARKLGITTAAAKGRLFHARVALRKACTQKTNPAFARRLRRAA